MEQAKWLGWAREGRETQDGSVATVGDTGLLAAALVGRLAAALVGLAAFCGRSCCVASETVLLAPRRLCGGGGIAGGRVGCF